MSVASVRVALRQAGVPVRQGGFNSWPDPPRRSPSRPHQPQSAGALEVTIPEALTPKGPFEALAPLPIADGLLRALYVDLGLPVFHMSLLLEVGLGAVRSGLKRAGVELR